VRRVIPVLFVLGAAPLFLLMVVTLQDLTRALLALALLGLSVTTLAGLPFIFFRTAKAVSETVLPGHCVECGYDMTGLPGTRCPECGATDCKAP